MTKAFNLFLWENEPSVNTPLGETLLNKVNIGLEEIDNRVINMDVTKANQTDLLTAVADVTFDEDTGIFTIIKKSGATTVIDTKLEKLAINFTYDADNQRLVLTLEDGTIQYVDLKELVTELDFLNSNTVIFSVSQGKVTANIAKGSITSDMLEPNYLANIQLYASQALSSANSAKDYASNSASSATLAESYTHGNTGARDGEDTDNAKYYMEQAKNIAGSDISNIIDGTTPVGNALALGGIAASEYALDADLANYLPKSGGDITANDIPYIKFKSDSYPNTYGVVRKYGDGVRVGLHSTDGSFSNELILGSDTQDEHTLLRLLLNDSAFREIIHSGNVGDYALPKSGGTVNGSVKANGIESTDGFVHGTRSGKLRLFKFTDSNGEWGSQIRDYKENGSYNALVFQNTNNLVWATYDASDTKTGGGEILHTGNYDTAVWTELTSGFDLNNAMGKYRTSQSTIVSSLLNKPTGVTSGEVTVEFHGMKLNTSYYGIQELRQTVGTNGYIHIRSVNGATFGVWKKIATSADLADYLPKSVGEGETIVGTGYNPLTIESGSANAFVALKNKNGIFGRIGIASEDDTLFYMNNSGANRKILHTGNKPSGTYTGNGSATSRTISTNGLGHAVMIFGNNSCAFVTPNGAVLQSNGTISALSYDKCKFIDGVLTIITDNGAINANGATYKYQVL